jgi:hypothetical protein
MAQNTENETIITSYYTNDTPSYFAVLLPVVLLIAFIGIALYSYRQFYKNKGGK